MKIRVAVIGAGAGGVVSLRHLLARPETFEAVAYEQCDAIGGTWIYVAETGMDKYGLPIHSSMYKNLRCVGAYVILSMFHDVIRTTQKRV